MVLPAPLDLLAAHADPSRVEHSAVAGDALVMGYALVLPDGQVRRFRLRIETNGAGGVSVGEADEPRVLPAACPQRHINGDGSFCLGLRGVDEPDLATQGGVDRWWACLAGYLMLQVLAEATGRWPQENAWRHGAAAAKQRDLENAYAAAPWLAARVASGPIVATGGRIESRRAPCPCGSGNQTRHCHEDALVAVAAALRRIEELEAEYYRQWSTPCCGTMAVCGVPLK